jgi:hypothetical protein
MLDKFSSLANCGLCHVNSHILHVRGPDRDPYRCSMKSFHVSHIELRNQNLIRGFCFPGAFMTSSVPYRWRPGV